MYTAAYNLARKGVRGLLACAVVAAGAAALATGAQAQSITSTKHNLSASGTGANHLDAASTDPAAKQICVFCHTPHGASTTAAAPIWNRQLADPSTYTLYSSTTFDGESTISLSNSVSLACLSCHDGTQAMDTVLNAPGSGWGDTGTSGGNTISPTSTWTGVNQLTDGMVTMLNDGTASLSNDHPVGMQYAKITADPTYGTLDADFTDATQDGTSGVWFVETASRGGSGAGKDKTDMILYTRSGDPTPRVECATCHDPHTTNATFLRIPNTQSNVCLTCHTK